VFGDIIATNPQSPHNPTYVTMHVRKNIAQLQND